VARTSAEVDAALAAAARAAAVPVASVQAAGPSRAARPPGPGSLVPALVRATPVAVPGVSTASLTPATVAAPATHGKDSVAAAIANAQARADNFLATGSGVDAASARPEPRPAQR
jgi:nicotinamidase-related amidase